MVGGIVPRVKIVSWSAGTDAEIAAMVNAYYAGQISLNDVKSVWSVGDKRTMALSAMSATGVSESHRTQNVEIQILDFDHDNLTTSINGITKALVSVQQKDCLMDATVTDNNGQNNTENGELDAYGISNPWNTIPRRTWCNSIYYNALPSTIKDVVKQVSKVNISKPGSGSTIGSNSDDYIWLPSEYEVYGSVTYASLQEGTQYKHYETTNNRYKSPIWESGQLTCLWWTRSPAKDTAGRYVAVVTPNSRYQANRDANNTLGIAPAFCL